MYFKNLLKEAITVNGMSEKVYKFIKSLIDIMHEEGVDVAFKELKVKVDENIVIIKFPKDREFLPSTAASTIKYRKMLKYDDLDVYQNELTIVSDYFLK